MKPVSVRGRRASPFGRPFHPPSRASREETVGPWSPRQAMYFDLLKKFVRRERHARVLYGHREGNFPLGAWVARERRAFRRSQLSPEQVALFEALPGWT